jgi:hypothetical protein
MIIVFYYIIIERNICNVKLIVERPIFFKKDLISLREDLIFLI